MAKYTALEVQSRGGDFVKVEKELLDPPAGYVRVKVHACGLCHADCFTKLGVWPGVSYPRTPGHEIAGEVDAVGPGVGKWKPGQRVGVGWFAGQCSECGSCGEGDYVLCDNKPVTGIQTDGGYAEYMYAKATALALIPDSLSYRDAAPLLCAGVTVYNGLRRTNALPGDLVAVHGMGALGHLAIQYARKMGFRVLVFSRGTDKKASALELGAHHYIDSTSEDIEGQAKAIGSIKVILATSTSPKAMSQVLPLLGKNGIFLVLGAGQDPIVVQTVFLIAGRRTIAGHPSGSSKDSEDALKFAAIFGVRPKVEVFPGLKAPEAYERMMSGDAQFKVVIDWDLKE